MPVLWFRLTPTGTLTDRYARQPQPLTCENAVNGDDVVSDFATRIVRMHDGLVVGGD